jgi:iron(III) transport system substrate-binding protein
MKKFLKLLLVSLMTLSLVACGGTETPTETEATETEETMDAGTLTIYSPNSDGEVDSMIPAFEEATGIKVDLISAGTGDCLTRIDAEKENPQADVLWGGMNYGVYVQYPTLWEEYVSENDAKLPEGYQNTTGYFTNYTLSGSAALLLNTDIFEELGLSTDDFTSYEDLLWPELKGRIAMGDPTASSSAWAELSNMLLVKGDEAYDDKAWMWVDSFMDNLDGIILSSSSAIYKGTSTGEYAVGVTYEDPAVSLLTDGATNLVLVYPEEGSVWLPAAAAIVKNAPNMDNAKLFLDFISSDEGQQIVAGGTTRPANVNFNNSNENMKPFSEITIAFEDIPFVAENKTDWQAKWSDMWTSK